MTKKAKVIKEVKIERPKIKKLSDKESLKRMKDFTKRKEKFVASVRKSEN